MDPSGRITEAEVAISTLAVLIHEGAVAAIGTAISFGAGYGAGTAANYACGNCFGAIGRSIYEATHDEEMQQFYPAKPQIDKLNQPSPAGDTQEKTEEGKNSSKPC